MKRCMVLHVIVLVLLATGITGADVFQAGVDRLVMNQNGDGGWDWPFRDEDPAVSNAPSVLAPTAMGLLEAYKRTGDPNHLAALQKVGTFFLSKRPGDITPEDGYLAVALDKVFGVTSYAKFVKENFYDALAAGTYPYDIDGGALLVNTSRYIELLQQRHGGRSNLAAVDLGLGLYAAGLMGADTKAWIAGTKAEINKLRSEYLFDVLGLAAGVLGLASVGEDIDPTSGGYAMADSLADLAAILASYQLATGGFTWNGYMMEEDVGNEQVQETAFALLALGQFDRDLYADSIRKGASYLESIQLPSGGWENFLGRGENDEVTGEALWAIGSAAPAQDKQGQ